MAGQQACPPWPNGPCCLVSACMFWAPFLWLSLHFGPHAGDSSSGFECDHWLGSQACLSLGAAHGPRAPGPQPSCRARRALSTTHSTGSPSNVGVSVSFISGFIVLFRSRWACYPQGGAMAWTPRKARAESRRPFSHRPGHLSSFLYSLKFLQ